MSDQRKTTSRKKKTSKGFLNYIHRVLNLVRPDNRITKVAINQMNAIMTILATEFSNAAREATQRRANKTVTSREVQYAVRSVLPGQLAKHAVSEGTKAITKFNSNDLPGWEETPVAGQHAAPIRRERAAGLFFSVSLCERFLRSKGASALRVGAGAPVYLAAVLEYLTAEILELAGNCTQDQRMTTIISRHIFLAVEADEELKAMISKSNIHLAGSGVLPYIHPTLCLPNKEKPHKKATKAAPGDVKKPHRFRPGTVALREIKRYQKSTEDMIQHLPFERLVRGIVEEFNWDSRSAFRFSEDVVIHLQGFIETCLVSAYKDAQILALHAGREGVNDTDLQLAWKFSTFPASKHYEDKEVLSDAPLQRLARRGGIKRTGHTDKFYTYSRDIINGVIVAVLKHAVLNIELLRTKTITTKILTQSISDIGYNFVVG